MTCGPSVFTIFTGDSKVMSMKAAYANAGDPLDLTSCTEIDVSLPNADGTFSHRLLSLSQVAITSPAVLGKFTATIPNTVSTLLNIGELQNVDVTFTISGSPMTVRFFGVLSVYQLD